MSDNQFDLIYQKFNNLHISNNHLFFVHNAKLKFSNHPLCIFISSHNDHSIFLYHLFSTIAYYKKYLKQYIFHFYSPTFSSFDTFHSFFHILSHAINIVSPSASFTYSTTPYNFTFIFTFDFSSSPIDPVVNEYVFFNQDLFDFFYYPQ